MRENGLDRREFLKVLAALPAVYSLSCDAPPTDSILLSPDESLRKLIRLIGPWSDSLKADEFIGRFIGAEDIVATYIPDLSLTLQVLADRFPDDGISIERVEFEKIPEEEKDLLIRLTKQLYSFIEVRFLVSGEPPWGECHSDYSRYTRSPAAS